MNKNQGKYFYTARLMDEALLALLQKKDYEFITVKEVCEKAGVNRSTFYLHYEGMDDLLKESYEYVIRRFYESFESEKITAEKVKLADKRESMLITPEYLKPYLEFVRQNEKVMSLIMKNATLFGAEKTFEKMYGDIFRPILDKFGVPKQNQEYVFAYYMHGVLAIIETWLKNGCARDVDDMIRLIIDCLPKIKDEDAEK